MLGDFRQRQLVRRRMSKSRIVCPHSLQRRGADRWVEASEQ